MSGTWLLARAAIVAQLNGVTADAGTDYVTETLAAYEWAPGGRQPADLFPYAFILPSTFTVGRGPGSSRELTLDVEVRVMLGPMAASESMEVLQKRYDAWVVALMDAWDDAATIDGAADISVEQIFSGLALFSDIERGWGFGMTFLNVHISEEKTFSA